MWRELPAHRAFSTEFLELRAAVYEWLADYYDGHHLTRAGDWLLALAPDAPEHLVLAALTHDLVEKGRAKLRWMCDRVRLPRGVGPAISHFEQAMVHMERATGG